MSKNLLSDALYIKQRLKVIKDCTESNNHTEALEVIARLFDYSKYYKSFELIEKLHDIQGYMPTELGKFRDILATEMLGFVERDYPFLYHEIKKCL